MSLAFAGKITLIRSVLQAMPSYLLSNGWVPRYVLENIEKEFRSLLWNGGNTGRCLSLIQWDKICHETKLGGPGFRKLELIHKVFMAEHLVRATHLETSIWARAARVKYRVIKNKAGVPCPAGTSWA